MGAHFKGFQFMFVFIFGVVSIAVVSQLLFAAFLMFNVMSDPEGSAKGVGNFIKNVVEPTHSLTVED